MNIWYGSYLLLHYLLLCSVHTIKDIIKDYTLSLFKFVQPPEVTGYGHRSSESYSVVSTAHGSGGTHCIQLSSSYTDDMVNERVLALLASSAAGRAKFVLDSDASVSMVNDPRLLHKSRMTPVPIAWQQLLSFHRFLDKGGSTISTNGHIQPFYYFCPLALLDDERGCAASAGQVRLLSEL